jgi:hypothetical protein
MISSVNSLATNAVTVLTGQKRAMVPVQPVSPVKAVKRRTGHMDDVFKAGDAIGSMIAIASKMSQLHHPIATGNSDGNIDVDAETMPAPSASGRHQSETLLEQLGMEALRQHATGTGPRAEWARAYLEAQESRMAEPAKSPRKD